MLFALASLSPTASLTIPSVAHAALKSGDDQALASMRTALSDVGMIALTGIPGYAALRNQVLADSAKCASWEQEHTFDDQTTRRTMASRTIPGPGGAQPFKTSATAECAEFTAAVEPFRTTVDEAVRLFGARLGGLLHVRSPLLTTREGFPFPSFFDVVDNGEHLEHIHAYSRPRDHPAKEEAGATLEMHTDQGLFIAFTPALLLSDNARAVDAPDASSFHIKLRSGEVVPVAFDRDSLVFMLGQGVQQVVKPQLLPGGVSPGAPAFIPRPTPHALSVAISGTARMWYGRMVLPPSDATVSGKALTFGEMRDAMNSEAASGSQSTAAIAIGCSGSEAADTRLHALNRRVLSEPAACNDGAGLQCWHRCMSLEEGDALGTPADNCAAQNLQLQCVNSRDQLSSGGHGDYFPSCTNTTTEEVPYPEPYPPLTMARRTQCTDVSFMAEAEAMRVEGGYAAAVNLTSMCGAVRFGPFATPGTPCVRGQLLYRMTADGVMHGKMVVHAGFGWLAFGLANPGGDHNGMNGARIVMALPGSPHTYSPATGLDVLPASGTVDEYIINEVGGSAFRFWQAPYAQPSLVDASLEAADCTTSMSFVTATIAGWPLDVTGENHFLWALNEADYFVGYHSSANRGHVTIDLGDASVAGGGQAETDEDALASEQLVPGPVPSSGSSSKGLSDGAVAGIAVALFVCGLGLGIIATYTLLISKLCVAASTPQGAEAGAKGTRAANDIQAVSVTASQVDVKVEAC